VAVGGVFLYRVPPELFAAYRHASNVVMGQQFALAEYAALLAAANGYQSRGLNVAGLTLLKVEETGLLPAEWASTTAQLGILSHTRAWLGSLGGNMTGVGIGGFYAVLDPVIRRYSAFASHVYFPFPLEFTNGVQHKRGQLIMIFTRGTAPRCGVGRSFQRGSVIWW